MRSWCAPWEPHLSSQTGSPFPTNTPSTNHQWSCHRRSTAPHPGTRRDPARHRHLPQGRAAAACAGSSFPWEQAATGCAFPPTALGSAAVGGTAGAEAPRVPLRWGASGLEPCAANAPGAALSAVVYTVKRTGGPGKRRLPRSTKGQPLPQSPLGPSHFPPASQQTAPGRGRVQPCRQAAGQVASGPGAQQPLLSCGCSATGKSTHLGWRCERALGARGRAAAPSRVLRAPCCTTAGAAARLHAG